MSIPVIEREEFSVGEDKKIVVERPKGQEDMWYVVLEEDKGKPLILDDYPSDVKQVVNAMKEQYGEKWYQDFAKKGYSRGV